MVALFFSWAVRAAPDPGALAPPPGSALSLTPGHACMTGFRPHASNGQLPDQPSEAVINGRPTATVRPEIIDWMRANGWQAGYARWQAVRRCQRGFELFAQHPSCVIDQPVKPAEGQCQGPRDGYEFLAMHRHLLHTLRSLWPDLKDLFAAWPRLPDADQYPPLAQAQAHPWPDAVRRAADAVTAIGRMSREEVLARWADEGAFGQWLQCGSTDGGLHPESLYGALITTAIPISQYGSTGEQLDLYLYWKAHAWIDRAWDRYRKALGKMPHEPQLQAALIRQCQLLSYWSQWPAAPSAAGSATDQPLFAHGQLNPAYGATTARIMGEVEAIEQVAGGQLFVKLNPHLVGVKSVWVTGVAPLAEGAVAIGRRYVAIGDVVPTAALDSSGRLEQDLRSPAVLLASAIQSPK